MVPQKRIGALLNDWPHRTGILQYLAVRIRNQVVFPRVGRATGRAVFHHP